MSIPPFPNTRKFLRLPLHSAAILAAGCVLACTDERAITQTEHVPSIRGLVTSDVAARLTPDGRFILPEPRRPFDTPIVTPARARELAAAFLKTWGRTVVAHWGSQRGTRLDAADAVIEPRLYYADSPYERFPDTYHPADRRGYGPMYLAYVDISGERVGVVAVSAYATDLGINRLGLIEEPPLGGAYFFTHMVADHPRDVRERLVVPTPEEAAEAAAKASGRKVSRVPGLALPSVPWHPALAMWEVSLDGPITVHRRGSSSASESTTTVFVGPGPTFLIPAKEQAATTRAFYAAGPSEHGRPSPSGSVLLARRPGMHWQYESVSIIPDEGVRR